MLEVNLLQQCNVVNLRMLANCCVQNYAPAEIHGLQITLEQEFLYFRIFTPHVFALSIPGRNMACVMTKTSMTSMHLTYEKKLNISTFVRNLSFSSLRQICTWNFTKPVVLRHSSYFVSLKTQPTNSFDDFALDTILPRTADAVRSSTHTYVTFTAAQSSQRSKYDFIRFLGSSGPAVYKMQSKLYLN